MLTRIHVNQHNIRKNRKENSNLPVITVKDYKQNRYAHTAEVIDDRGQVACRVVYRPDKPLSCGAQVWIETDLEVVTDVQGQSQEAA